MDIASLVRFNDAELAKLGNASDYINDSVESLISGKGTSDISSNLNRLGTIFSKELGEWIPLLVPSGVQLSNIDFAKINEDLKSAQAQIDDILSRAKVWNGSIAIASLAAAHNTRRLHMNLLAGLSLASVFGVMCYVLTAAVRSVKIDKESTYLEVLSLVWPDVPRALLVSILLYGFLKSFRAFSMLATEARQKSDYLSSVVGAEKYLDEKEFGNLIASALAPPSSNSASLVEDFNIIQEIRKLASRTE